MPNWECPLFCCRKRLTCAAVSSENPSPPWADMSFGILSRCSPFRWIGPRHLGLARRIGPGASIEIASHAAEAKAGVRARPSLRTLASGIQLKQPESHYRLKENPQIASHASLRSHFNPSASYCRSFSSDATVQQHKALNNRPCRSQAQPPRLENKAIHPAGTRRAAFRRGPKMRRAEFSRHHHPSPHSFITSP
ncbi:hypothetical protein BDW67DRAFT_160987 [Aspergillus spinulosporus]